MPMSFIIFDERFCFALCENASAIILNLQNYHFFLIMANEECGLLLSHVGNEDTGEDLRAFVAQVTRVAEVGDFGIN